MSGVTTSCAIGAGTAFSANSVLAGIRTLAMRNASDNIGFEFVVSLAFGLACIDISP
jgi:hypothetical protein